jgi:hypothetical protein
MQLKERLEQQRVKYIVSSYQLDDEDDRTAFNSYLDELLSAYPTPLIELALVEILVAGWLSVPLVKGRKLLERVHEQLQNWQDCAIASTITAAQFQQITGLNPTPIFGPSVAVWK